MRAFMRLAARARRRDRRSTWPQQEAELVDAVQQAVARERLDRERHRAAVRQRAASWLSRSIVDLDARIARAATRASLRRRRPAAGRSSGELLRKMSAISVLIDGAEAVVEQRPGRVLARGAAAEVAAGDQHLAARGRGLVQHEVGLRRAVGVVAPVGEQRAAEALARRWCVRKRAGMIWSVSMLVDGSTTVRERI